MELIIKIMTEEDKINWKKFKENFNPKRFQKTELKIVFELHAKIFNHKYQELKSCNCGNNDKQKIAIWIKELDEQYIK